MWRKPRLIIENVDDLITKIEAKAFSYYPTPKPMPTPPIPIPLPIPGGGCVIERCSYGAACDVFPVW